MLLIPGSSVCVCLLMAYYFKLFESVIKINKKRIKKKFNKETLYHIKSIKVKEWGR